MTDVSSAPRTRAELTETGRRRGRRGDLGLAVLCGATAIGLALDRAPAATAALLAVTMLVVPGVFVAASTRPRGPVERSIVVMTVSVTTWMLVAHVMLTLQQWSPRTVGVAVATAAFVGACLRQRPGRPRLNPTLWATRLRAFGAHVGKAQIVASLVALALWAGSLPLVETNGFDDWGLITAVPPSFFVAYAIAIVVAVAASFAPRTSPGRVAVGIAPLLVMIYGTLPLLFETIRYPWAYKHVGVIRLLDDTGKLHESVDIYNNFSGFFGLAAFVRGATGVDPTSYGAWTQLAAQALILVAVWLLIRRATDSERVAHVAVVLYLLTDWVGQNYFAAQTLATFLSLSVLALSMSWFFGGATRSLPWFGSALSKLAPDTRNVGAAPAQRARRLVVLFAFLGLMMTHPLTPVATAGALVLAWAIGWIRDTKLIAGLGAVGLAWALRSATYFLDRSFDLGFGGSPGSNADGNLDYSAAPDAVVAVGNLTRVFSVGVWVLAIVGALLCAWAMRRTGALLLAACIPFGIPLVQSYGGEAIYRVYLYSLPLMVGLAAWGLVTRTPIERRAIAPQPTVLASVICLALGAGFLVAHFGRERINNVDPSEVEMGDYISATIDDPALLAQFAGTYPAASTARYPAFQVNDTYVPEIVDLVDASGRAPTLDELDKAADDLWALDAGVPYVIVSPGMIDSIAQVAALPVESTTDAIALLTASDRFVVRHRIDDSFLVGVTP